MVLYADFGEFFNKAKEMFTASPNYVRGGGRGAVRASISCLTFPLALPPRRLSLPQTRLVQKYRHVDGLLTLKVTNDIACLKYKTDNAADLKNVERLTGWFLSQSTRKHVAGAGKTGGAVGGAGGPADE